MASRLLAALFVLAVAAPATAATKTVTFDDPSTPAGTRVSTEDQASTGVAFTQSAGTRPLVKAVGGLAHSGDRIGVYSCEGLPGCGEGFSTPVLHGDLTTSVNAVSAFVGYYDYGGGADTARVRIRAFNNSTGLVAESPYVTVSMGAPLDQQVTATSPSGRTIDYFEVTADETAADYGNAIAIDDVTVTINDAEPPPAPDFSLNEGQNPIDVPTRGSVDVPIDLSRSNGSNGDISFAVSGLPSGVTASFEPNPVPATATHTTLRLSAAATQVHGDQYANATITATPAGPAVGAAQRTLIKQVRVRVSSCAGERVLRTDGIRVCSPMELKAYLEDRSFRGRLIIPADVAWEMTVPCAGKDELGRCIDVPMDLPIYSNVAIVGERGDRGSRPLLFVPLTGPYYFDELGRRTAFPNTLFEVDGNNVSVEGLHIRGPNAGRRDPRKVPFLTTGIRVYECPAVLSPVQYPADTCRGLAPVDASAVGAHGRGISFADNELDEWAHAIEAQGPGTKSECGDTKADEALRRIPRRDAGQVRIVRNYIHHNSLDGSGYGVVVSQGAWVTIEGNVFDANRHSVTADCHAHNGYLAHYNYLLEKTWLYGTATGADYYAPHFDAHGAIPPRWIGGVAGDYYEITHNTVRGEQPGREAFVLRGTPRTRAVFADNVVVQNGRSQAVRVKSGGHYTIGANAYDTDYSKEIAAGDFDGDGITDVFVATGTAWFYSSGGVSPWMFLRDSDQRTGTLAFADIDNDGITDVIQGTGFVRWSKSGRSDPVTLTGIHVRPKDLRFGDFNGDGLTDMFEVDGTQWKVWDGKTKIWIKTRKLYKAVSELLFGDFDDVKGTDVAFVEDNRWVYSRSASLTGFLSQQINKQLAKSFKNAVAADFDGDGMTDIALDEGNRWTYSSGGRKPLQTLLRRQAYRPLKQVVIGRFEGTGAPAGAVTFTGNRLAYFKRNTCCFAQLSLHDMR